VPAGRQVASNQNRKRRQVFLFFDATQTKEVPMGWGDAGLGDNGSRGSGWQGVPMREMRMPAQYVFVTSDDLSRSFCHQLCGDVRLAFADVRIAHNQSEEVLGELIPRARVVIIATCRASLDKDSAAQLREKFVADLALKHGVRVAILAGKNHEAAQDHLAAVRATAPLVIVPGENGYFGEGFTEHFPLPTQFVERGDSPEHLERIADEVCKRAAYG
jgi:hypothetical protein